MGTAAPTRSREEWRIPGSNPPDPQPRVISDIAGWLHERSVRSVQADGAYAVPDARAVWIAAVLREGAPAPLSELARMRWEATWRAWAYARARGCRA